MEFGAKGQKKAKPIDVFKNVKGRYTGLIKALTTGFFFFFFFLLSFLILLYLIDFVFFLYSDVDEFYKQCDPGKDISF